MLKGLKRGFTLIELLIVIAIIGILAGVVVVSSSTATTKAKKTSAMASLDSVNSEIRACVMTGTSVAAYSSDGSTATAICTGGSNYPSIDGINTAYVYNIPAIAANATSWTIGVKAAAADATNTVAQCTADNCTLM